MRTKHIYILIHIRIGDEVGAINIIKPSSDFLLTITRWCFFWESFLLFLLQVYLYNTVLAVPCSLAIICLERTDLLSLLCVLLPCVFFIQLFHVVSRVMCGTWLINSWSLHSSLLFFATLPFRTKIVKAYLALIRITIFNFFIRKFTSTSKHTIYSYTLIHIYKHEPNK